MTDGDGLLAAVLARPADDTPRLILADWLDDQPAEVPCEGKCEGYIVPGHYPDDIHLRKPTWLPCPTCSGRGWVPSGAAASCRVLEQFYSERKEL